MVLSLRRGLLGGCVLLAATAGHASSATAKLRAPHLSDSCARGYSYGEQAFYSLVVEGCSKTAEPQGQESGRRVYRGTVEVNGLLIEGPGDLIASSKRNARRQRDRPRPAREHELEDRARSSGRWTSSGPRPSSPATAGGPAPSSTS